MVQVETTSPKFYTPTGLSVQSSAAEAGAFLGEEKGAMLLKTLGSSSPRYYLLFHNAHKGIAFFFNVTEGTTQRGKCVKVAVFSSLLPLPFFSRAFTNRSNLKSSCATSAEAELVDASGLKLHIPAGFGSGKSATLKVPDAGE